MELIDAALPAPAVGGFATRIGGTSAAPWGAANLSLRTGDEWDRVHANRDLLARRFGLTYRDLTFARQVHGAGVRFVERSTGRGRDRGLPGADALVTTESGLGLVILGADCPPVLLADPVAGVVGVAHVGRAGLVAGVLPATVALMVARGAAPSAITAVVGPGACGACYEVPEALAAQVELAVPGSRSRSATGTPSIDLTAGAVGQLRSAGVGIVRTQGGCTLEQPERWFSYRRDGVTGRHGALALLR